MKGPLLPAFTIGLVLMMLILCALRDAFSWWAFTAVVCSWFSAFRIGMAQTARTEPRP